MKITTDIVSNEEDFLRDSTEKENSKEDGKEPKNVICNLNLNGVDVGYALWKEESISPTMLTNSNSTHGINIPNNGEILTLPLFSLAYQLKQSDDINNAKSTPGCENSIGDLDGIQDEYYQVKRKCGSIYERSDGVNPPSLSPEPPAYAISEEDANSNLNGDKTTTAPVTRMDIVATKAVSSNLNVATTAAGDNEINLAFCMDIASTAGVSSNLNVVTAAGDDEINLNAKSKLDDGNLIGILSNMPYIILL